MRGGLLLALGLAAALAACAQRQVMREGVLLPYEEAAHRDLERARSALEEGDPAQAVATLERFGSELAESRRLDQALLLLGEAQLALGAPEQAAQSFRRVLVERPRSRLAPEAAYRAAEVYRQLGRPGLARTVLADAPFRRAPEALRARMYRLLADLARELGDYPEAVRALALVRREATDEDTLREVDLELEELLRDRLRDAELVELADRLPRGPVYDRALLERTRRALARGDYGEALAALDRLPRRLRPVDERERQRLRERVERAAETTVYPIGLALPLSGPYAAFGAAALRGVVLGLEVFADPPGRYRLAIRDTAGDPERAKETMRELAREGVRAIIGPVRSSVAAESAPEAQLSQIPLLTLAKREQVSQAGAYVFRLGVAPSDQVAMLAEYALRSGPTGRFAILYPRDPQGVAFKNLFWDEMELRGGSIVGVEGYPPDAVDFQEAIRKLVGLHYLTDEERQYVEERDRLLKRPLENSERLAAPELQDLPPYVDFDALFIPDLADRVALVLPQLRFYDVADVILLGPNDWNHPRLVEIAGRDARGAVFAGAFHAASRDPEVQRFVSAYFEAYGEAPDLFAATGYDAAVLLRGAIQRNGHPSSVALQRELLQADGFRGVTGLSGFDSGGAPQRSLRLLKVRRGAIVESSDSPASGVLPGP